MNSISWILSLVTPMLLHMVLSEFSVVLLGSSGNTALCTTAAAAMTIPIAAFLLRREQGKSRSPIVQPLFSVFCFAAGGILNIIWSGILNWIQIGEMFSNATQEALLASELILQVIGLGLIVPLAEELIFRGLIYNRMKQLLSVPLSVFFSALLFAVYHGNPIQMIFAFPMALALAAVYEKGRSFLFPVLFHMGANLTAILVNLG